MTNPGLLFEKPAVMGVINASPNSFYNPIDSIESALREAETMVSTGAAIIDVGGEATNPNVIIERDAPSVQEEIDRVVPVIEAIAKRFDVCISVDTSQATVMCEAVKVGAGMINDQRALREEHALETAAELQVPVCLMHSRGLMTEDTSQRNSEHQKKKDLETFLLQVKQALLASVQRCEDAGILRDRLLIDPGFGQGNYGKNVVENYYLLSQLNRFQDLDLPILVGWSRKSMIGDVLNVPPQDRLYGSISAAVIAAMNGASVIRVHDVKETVDAIKIFQATATYVEEV